MMRTTGYSLAITGLIQAAGQTLRHGVTTPDEGMPFEGYVTALRQRGINVKDSATH
jgi:hypothetical protein